MKYLLAELGTGVGLVLVTIVIYECASLGMHYEREPAVIRKVVMDESWGAMEETTLGRFQDGAPAEEEGDLGEVGETVLFRRQRGTSSLFGILGDRRCR